MRRAATVARRRRPDRRDDESGALSVALPILALALLVLAGLGIDGSRQLNTRGQAVAFAEEAARDGALAIYPDEPVLRLNEPEVRRRVAEYCAEILPLQQVTRCEYVSITPGINGKGERDATPLVVEVRVETQIKPSLLGIVYNRPLTASGIGRARPIEGVNSRSQ